jgi:DNA invertase Pin-like site-specific DNA recombinase
MGKPLSITSKRGKQTPADPPPAVRGKIGYARVSTDEQDTALQEEALQRAGCEKVFSEHASGGRWDRPQLHAMLDFLRPGDTVVVHRLDRLSRSLKDLIHILEKIEQSGATFTSISERIETDTPAGRAMLQIAGVFAEFERSIIRDRTLAGVRRAQANGKHCGRPGKLSDEQKAEIARLVHSGQKSQAEVARLFSADPATVCRIVHSHKPTTKTTKANTP